MIRRLSPKDLSNFISYCSQTQDSDFFVTKNRKRLFLNKKWVCQKVFNDCLKHGDICFISEENGEINGVLLVVGFSDNFPKKYLKISAHNKKIVNGLLKVLGWNFNQDIYIKIKKYNLFRKCIENKGFKFLVQRNKELLYFRPKLK